MAHVSRSSPCSELSISRQPLNERDTNRKLTTEYRAGKEIREKWT